MAQAEREKQSAAEAARQEEEKAAKVRSKFAMLETDLAELPMVSDSKTVG